MRHRPTRKRPKEPTITLINVVFLMLIFFLIAGTIAPPLDPELKLVSTTDLEGREPPDALVITAEGELLYRGAPMDPDQYLAIMAAKDKATHQVVVRIVPDRNLPALKLLGVGRALQDAGADQVFLVTERGLE